MLLVFPIVRCRQRFEAALALALVSSHTDDSGAVIHKFRRNADTFVYGTANPTRAQIQHFCEQEQYERVVLVMPGRAQEELQHEKLHLAKSVDDFEPLFPNATAEELQNIERIFAERERRPSIRIYFGEIIPLEGHIFSILGEDDMAATIRASERTYDEEQNAKKRTLLDADTQDDTWQKRLKLAADAQQNSNNDDEKSCVVCQDAQRAVVFDPCCHQVICARCAVEILERDDQDKLCPLCRKGIIKVLTPIN